MTDAFVPVVKLCKRCVKLLDTAMSLEEMKRRACKSCRFKIQVSEKAIKIQQANEIDSDGFSPIK